MIKRLHISLIFSDLVVYKLLSAVILDMCNFVIYIRIILEICKQLSGNQVNKIGIPSKGLALLNYWRSAH